MNTILATATTWTVVSIFAVSITSRMVEAGVSHFQAVSETMAEATGASKGPQTKEQRVFGSLLADCDWPAKVGVGEVAVKLSGRCLPMIARMLGPPVNAVASSDRRPGTI